MLPRTAACCFMITDASWLVGGGLHLYLSSRIAVLCHVEDRVLSASFVLGFSLVRLYMWTRSLVVKALGYKPQGRGFETPCGEIFNLSNPSGHIRSWGPLSL
jgi:hypothetical protein